MWYVAWTLTGLLILGLSTNEGYAQRTPPTPAVLTISDATTYSFGNTIVNGSSEHTFLLTNSGEARAYITEPTLTAPFSFKGGSFPGTGGNCGKSLWGGNRTCKMVVVFSPTSTGNSSKTLTVSYNDGYQTQTTSRAMTGTGVTGATLAFNPSSFDYSNLAAGSSTTKTFTLTNSGQTVATQVTAAQPGSSFSFINKFPGTGGTCGDTLAAGASCTVIITFAPAKNAQYNATVTLKYFSGVANTTLTLALSGKGTGANPNVTAISPTSGPSTGGTTVTITGSTFAAPATVSIGGATCTSPTVVNSTTITCVTGANATTGASNVVVTIGASTYTLIGGFVYQLPPSVTSVSPNEGANNVTTAVTVNGTGFQSGMTISFGGSACTGVSVISGSTATCAAPALATQSVTVSVSNPDGLSGSMANAFSYKAAWIWMSGSSLVGQSSGVNPGGRDSATYWTDSSNNFWMFGGWGYNSAGSLGRLNDLWKFNGATWTKMAGSALVNQKGIYGTKGAADPANYPGSRVDAVAWVDSSGNFWMFGGSGLDSAGAVGNLNDLWKFDGTNWTWMSGSNLRNQKGVYGTMGMTASTNVPGGRLLATQWIDNSNNLWMFGGFGADSVGNRGDLNDTWVFNGTDWTWMSGSTLRTQAGNFGTMGVTVSTNVPSARDSSFGWRDSSGNFWMLGGTGVDSALTAGNLNDLWKFNGTDWTWMGGSNLVNAYNTGMPSARNSGKAWIDSSNNLWLFGGYGVDTNGFTGELNDLWKFDGASWTFMAGGTTADTVGNYGTQGIAALTNMPGTRQYASSWIDSSNNLWLFGGYGFDSAGVAGQLSDLWVFKQ